MSRLLYVVTEDWYFLSHRLPMKDAAKDAGFDVHLVARSSGLEEKITDNGVIFHSLSFNRGGLSLLSILKECFLLLMLIYKIKPTLIHFVAIRPILLGALLTPFTLNIKKIFAFAGLGAIFGKDKSLHFVRKAITMALKYAFKTENISVLFQNKDDLKVIQTLTGLSDDKITLIRGSGVDVKRYQKALPPAVFTIGLVARMLKSKGIEDAIAASHILTKRAIPHKLLLVGDIDSDNPDSLTLKELESLLTPSIEWLGYQQDIAKIWQGCSVAILPQREREGLPKSLLEAAACSLPLITTNVAGCREVVIDGENGFLIEPHNSLQLANSLLELYNYKERPVTMGQQSKNMIDLYFSAEIVKAQTYALYCRHK